MADTHDAGHLSIGEVLGLLLEEFDDITISKIRFLESQGLISPERTASGYRKFYDGDVELLRVILTEQRQNYLPLRVIKDRLQTGEIDPSGEHLRPNGDAIDVTESAERDDQADEADPAERVEGAGDDVADVPPARVAAHPASRGHQSPDHPSMPGVPSASGRHEVDAPQASVPVGTQLLPGVLLDRAELCGMVGMTEDELEQLESFGIIAPRDGGGASLYDDDAVEIAKLACEFLRAGVDARHLRNWRTSAEREASLYEQLVTPRFRQRNPEARAEALQQLRRLDDLGGSLRAAMTRHTLRHHFES